MSETEQAPAAEPAQTPLEIGPVAEVIATMTRLISRLSEEPSVKAEGLGLAEWLSLRQIAANTGMRQNQLASKLGVTRQRGNHIAKSLRDTGLITIVPAESGKGGTLQATDAGEQKATKMDEAILSTLSTRLEGKGNSLIQLRKRLGQISKAMAPPKGKGGKKKNKKQKPQAAADDIED